jgi:hypothetical protein
MQEYEEIASIFQPGAKMTYELRWHPRGVARFTTNLQQAIHCDKAAVKA